MQRTGSTGDEQLQVDGAEGGEDLQTYLDECLQRGIDLADPGPEISGAFESDEYEDISMGPGQGGLLSILRCRAKKKKHKKRAADSEDAEAVAKRQYFAGDGLLDRSICRLSGIQLDVKNSDSEDDGLVSPGPKGTGRRRGLWNSRTTQGRSQDCSVQQEQLSERHGRPLQVPEEIQAVGHSGTEVTMKLEPSEEQLGTLGIHRQDPAVRGDSSQHRSNLGNGKHRRPLGSPMKKIGKGLLHHVGKTAHHAKEQIHHVMQRKKSAGGGRGSSVQSPRFPMNGEGKHSDGCGTCGSGSEEYTDDPPDLDEQICTTRCEKSPSLSPKLKRARSAQPDDENEAPLPTERAQDLADLDEQMKTMGSAGGSPPSHDDDQVSSSLTLGRREDSTNLNPQMSRVEFNRSSPLHKDIHVGDIQNHEGESSRLAVGCAEDRADVDQARPTVAFMTPPVQPWASAVGDPGRYSENQDSLGPKGIEHAADRPELAGTETIAQMEPDIVDNVENGAGDPDRG